MKKLRVYKLLVLCAWIVLIGGFAYLWKNTKATPDQIPALLSAWLDHFGRWNAVLLFWFVHTLRPLVFFPSTLFAITAGMMFGPWWGMCMTAIGETTGAQLAFSLSRMLGRDWVKSKERGIFAEWDRRLATRGLYSVMVMRLIYLPFDSTSYACGLSSLKRRDFFFGTFLGALPFAITWSMLGGGAAMNGTETTRFLFWDVDPRHLVWGVGILSFFVGLAIAWMLRRTRFAANQAPLPAAA